MDTGLALLGGLALIALSITFLAFRVSRALVVNVAAPTALLPDSVRTTLDELNAKMKPAVTPIDDATIGALVYEAVATAEQSKNKGRDRFIIARDYVKERAEKLQLFVDPRDLALRIEGAVAVSKKK